MRLLLARHAPTDWNATGRFQGHQDIALGAAGRQMTTLLAARLANERIDEIHASDLRRAAETAGAVAETRKILVRTDPRLRELNFGVWEGRTYEDVGQAYPEALSAWEADPVQVPPPGGETLAQMASRIGAFLGAIRPTDHHTERDGFGKSHVLRPGVVPPSDRTAAEHAPERTVLVVAHKGSLQVLLCLVLGLPPRSRWQFGLDPASVSELNLYPEGAILNFQNDTHHLHGAARAGPAAAHKSD